MTSLFSPKTAPLMVCMFTVKMFVGCGGQEAVQGEQNVIQTTAAQLNQQDVDTFTSAVNLKGCTFVVAAGAAKFIPSSELAQRFYGDPNGDAHKLTFPVPMLSSGGAKISLTKLNAELANTGLTLAGSSATVKLGFNGMLRVSVPVPVVGMLTTDIQINSSSVSVTLVYDTLTERVRASRVTSRLAFQAKNCGPLGWCNRLVDKVLNLNLLTWAEVPLRDAITKGLDNADTTARLNTLLVAGYNLKDPEATPWTMVPSTLNIASGAFNFIVQRNLQ